MIALWQESRRLYGYKETEIYNCKEFDPLD